MGTFSARRKTPVEKLERKLQNNPSWPFERLPDGKFVYSVWYSRFILGIAGFVLSCGTGVMLYVMGLLGTNFFLWCITGLVLSCFAIMNYYNRRSYVIDHEARKYSFKLGDATIVCDDLHNIYIRMRSRVDAGRTYHFLIFSGYRVDKIYLSEASEEVAGLRRLGMQLAETLGINYFDNKNISPLHVVRNFPKHHPDYVPPEERSSED